PRGRPKGFIPDQALDRAVEMFWEHGYEGVDVDRIARAVNVTKPALYRAFGDKSTLLLKAVEHYAMTHIAPTMAAFQAEPDIHQAVTAFSEAIVHNATGEAKLARFHSSMITSVGLRRDVTIDPIAEIAAKFAEIVIPVRPQSECITDECADDAAGRAISDRFRSLENGGRFHRLQIRER